MQDPIAQALTAIRQKNYALARSSIVVYGKTHPLEFQHYLLKGLSELALEDWDSAEATLAKAVDLFPHQPQLWFNWGLAQENLNNLDAAVLSFLRCLELKSDQPEVYGNLSNIYCKQGLFSEAEKMAHRAYELGASKPLALNSLGLALSKQGKYIAAEKIFHDVLALDPKHEGAYANLANLKVDQMEFEAAWPFFSAARAISHRASIRRDEGMARLLAGEYDWGWNLYEARLELPNALRVRPLCSRYAGEPVEGKHILLLAEQGFGDAIQFCRYGPLLSAKGARLTWVLPKPLLRLFSSNLPGQFLEEGEVLPNADYYIPLLSLPGATGLKSFQQSPNAPYLKALRGAKFSLPSSDLKVGLVWAGSRTHQNDRHRSMSQEEFSPFFALSKTQFYALSKNEEDIKSASTVVTDLAYQFGDFADTASQIEELDCVVAVDTAVAHLAGALGKKTFLLLPYCPDWRWGIEGTTTPWYANHIIVRQSSPSVWQDVVEKVRDQLQLMSENKR